MQVTQPIQPFDGKGQRRQQPFQQQAVVVVMRNVFHCMLVLGFIEALVFDLPATLGHTIQRASADSLGREIGEPICLDHLLIAFVLAVVENADGGPAQTFPKGRSLQHPKLRCDRLRSEN
jgi:hypothetical protein